jgi:TonB family protein
MTLTIKNSPDSNSPGKPGAPSQNNENNSGQSPRSNPVCLELGVIIRSMPTEANGLTQPIREEGRTVIVFDNGAVLRSTSNLPVGQTVIVSNPNGRDVVCRVVGGRNLPNVKGYVEVEFIEPVKDFWGIHQDPAPVAVAAPPITPFASRESYGQPSAPPPRVATLLDPPGKPASVSLGSGPTFEDIPGLSSVPLSTVTREPKTQSARPGPEKFAKEATNYNLSENAEPTSVANWRPPESELPTEKRAIAAMRDALSTASSAPAPAPTRDFMSKGLMAYEQPRPSSSASGGRMPMILGAAAFVLAGVGAVVFFLHRGTAPVSDSKADAVSQPSLPEPLAAKSAPQHVQAPQGESAQAAAQTQSKIQAQAVAVGQAQPAATIAAVPVVVTSTENTDSRTDPGNARRQEENAVVKKQPNLASSRRPAIPNLKIGAPSAPSQNPANLGDGAAPLTDIASTESIGGNPPAGLLTSSGRTSNPPAPPPSVTDLAPAAVAAPKTVREPKLISSTRPVYPPTAKQSEIQGNVTISANIDQNGKVVSARALNGPMLLRQAAEEAVRQWKYSPGLVDGKPAPSQVTVGVEFRLH